MSPPAVLLVVEDEPNDVLFIRRGLASAGIKKEIQVARDGEEAVAYLKGQEPFGDREKHPLPSLVLLDLKLPRRSGLEVLEWLRKEPSPLREIPVIVLTSSKEPRDVDRATELGILAYHVKPVGYAEFMTRVESIGQRWLPIAGHPS